ncbi:hypothetical protein [Acuticoccus sp.]|uniref:hypothetical protein n=1 Tax=Acuticoccus sp. TaxID=1904378 RepID=UPI003B52C11B
MNRPTQQIEREVEAQRYEVEETLEALRAKLSTAQIMESVSRAFTGAGGQGSEFLGNLGRQVKENPLPIALTGVGLAWLLMSQGKASQPSYPTGSQLAYDRARFLADEQQHGADYAVSQLKAGAYSRRTASSGTAYDSARYAADEGKHGAEYAAGQLKAGAYKVSSGAQGAAQSAYDQARFAADEAKHGLRYAGDQLKSGAYAVQDTASSAIDTAYDSARFAADEAKHGAQYVSEQLQAGAYAVSDAASNALHSARDAAYDAADTARVYGGRAQRNAMDFIKEEPLIAAAVGVAVGAALGAALPSTRTEDEIVGPYRDNLRDEALDYAAEQAERAERVASASLTAAEQTAKDEGLVPSEGGKTVAERAESVVQSAKDAAKNEAKSS